MSWKNNADFKTSVKSIQHVTLNKFLKYERKTLFLKTSGMSTAAQEK